MILCLGTTPAVQRVMAFRQLELNAVNRAASTLEGAAGKSINVAKVLQTLGETPLATGFLGGERGAFLRAVLTERRLEHEFVTVATPTRQCVTVLDESAHTHTELVEEAGSVTPADTALLLDIVARRLRACRAIVMSGTLARGVPPDFYKEVTQLARAAGVLSVVDAQGAALHEALSAKPDLVKPNQAELSATLGRAMQTDADLCGAMRELCQRGAQRVVVTAGAKPSLAFDGAEVWQITTPQLAAVNPIGSGDAFTAGLVWRLLRGEGLEEASRWASAAGAANVLTSLAGEVNRKDVDRLVQEVTVQRLKV